MPDLITPASGGLAAAIRDHVTAHRGNTAFTLHFTDMGGWIDAGFNNAGRFTIDDEPTGAAAHIDGNDDDIDPWMFPPVDPYEHRRGGDATQAQL
ncbi:hypothetical protein [Arthrobacter pigmenti]